MKHFTTVTLEFPDCFDDLIVSAFIQGLREGELHTSLAKKTPKNFDDILQRATMYINLEEAVKLKKIEVRGKEEKLQDAVKGRNRLNSGVRSLVAGNSKEALDIIVTPLLWHLLAKC